MYALMLLMLVAGSTMADLQATATYGDTTLKFYALNSDDVSQPGASARCARKGGELVMPKDQKLNEAATSLASGNYMWIAGGDFGSENYFIWADGSDMEWTSWDIGEPNNVGDGGEDCIVGNWGNIGKWNDLSCCKTAGYVCQIRNKIIGNYDNVFTLYANEEALSYSQAKQFCSERRSRMAVIKDQDDMKNLMEKLNNINEIEFWVNEDESASDDDFCKTMDTRNLILTDCTKRLAFVCEQVPPYGVKISNENPLVVESTSLKVDCSGSGIPSPSVAWYRNNEIVKNQTFYHAGSTLFLNKITSEDADMYVCRAKNEIEGKTRIMEGYSFVEIHPHS